MSACSKVKKPCKMDECGAMLLPARSQEARFRQKPKKNKMCQLTCHSISNTSNHQPCNLLILPLPWLHLQALLIHLMHVTRSLHVAKDVVLQVHHGLQRVRDVLELLNALDDLCSLGAFGEVDEGSALDHGRDTIFDECQVR